MGSLVLGKPQQDTSETCDTGETLRHYTRVGAGAGYMWSRLQDTRYKTVGRGCHVYGANLTPYDWYEWI